MRFSITYSLTNWLGRLLFWLLLICVSCDNREDPPPAELQLLLENFVGECKKRGIPITDLQSAITIRFGRVPEHAGSCKPRSYPKVITIDSITWRVLSPATKEILVYHELSHCLLNRQHDNQILALGECKSWMRSDIEACTINFLNIAWREYYINELFLGDCLETPGWYDLESLPDKNALITTTSDKIKPVKSNALSFDSVYFNNRSEWLISISFQLTAQPQGSFGLRINEYAVEFSITPNLANPHEVDINRWITLEQFPKTSPHNLLSLETTAASTMASATVSVRRKNQLILVYFDKILKLCIPIQKSGIGLRGYNSFSKTTSPLKIRVYTL